MVKRLRSDGITNDTRRPVRALAHLVSVQVLESRSQGPIHIVVLAEEPVLTGIAQMVEFVAPMAAEVEPLRRRVRGHRGRSEDSLVAAVCICMGIQQGIP